MADETRRGGWRCAPLALLAATACLVGCGGARSSETRHLVYEQALATDGFVSDTAADGWIWRAELDGSHATRLVRGSSPVLSPDGLWIAYVRAQTAELWLMKSDGSGATRLRNQPREYVAKITWSPDSTRLAVVDSNGGMRIVGRDGSSRRVIRHGAWQGFDIGGVSFSPSGDRIAFAGMDTAGEDVYVVDVLGTRLQRLTRDHRSTAPLWGPESIAYARSRHARDGIWVMRPDGSGKRRLTGPEFFTYPAAWSADGRRLLAAAPPTHNGRLWAIDVATGRARALTDWVGDLSAQGLSRDGRTVLAAIGCGGIPGDRTGILETIAFDGGEGTIVAEGPCRGSWNA